MLAEKDFGRRYTESFLEEVLDPKLIAEPGDHRFAKHPVGARKHLHAG